MKQLQNQTSVLNHIVNNNGDCTITLLNGQKIHNAKITSHDQFTIIIQDENKQYPQQIDFLESIKGKEVQIGFINGETLSDVVTGSDIHSIIFNNSTIVYKSGISFIEYDGVVLIFKHSIINISF